MRTNTAAFVLAAMSLPLASCGESGNVVDASPPKIVVTITGARGSHAFTVEQAKTAAAQEEGLDVPH